MEAMSNSNAFQFSEYRKLNNSSTKTDTCLSITKLSWVMLSIQADSSCEDHVSIVASPLCY